MRSDVLVAEISGKRPGDYKNRPTEKMKIEYDHLIVSNNSDGYITDWKIVDVPLDYVKWYCKNAKQSENAWYAPMNRSYAINYAREHGYRYLVQLDDNIKFLELSYLKKNRGIDCRYRRQHPTDMLNDFIDVLVTVLENTNAGMAGCGMAGISNPNDSYLSERYVYSLFALDLQRCPDYFHGDFEDDIEFRLKLTQMGVPCIQVAPLKYSKTGQAKMKDLTGCRKEYANVGVKRGEHMRKLYGDIYSCGIAGKANRTNMLSTAGEKYFKHVVKPVKVGVLVKDQKKIDEKIENLFKKWAYKRPDRCSIKIKRK